MRLLDPIRPYLCFMLIVIAFATGNEMWLWPAALLGLSAALRMNERKS